MTENEAFKFIGQAVIESGKALEALQSIKSEAERIGKIGEYYANLDNCIKEIEACRVAMIALEEIQQYRAIGTVKDFKNAVEIIRPRKPYKGSFGTILCSLCGEKVGQMVTKTIKEGCMNFCANCGSMVDWSE